MNKKIHNRITISIFMLTVIASSVWFMSPVLTTQAEKTGASSSSVETKEPTIKGKHVVVHLNTMSLELKDGDTVLKTLPLLSQGKPGSYYETIGGRYANDYKTPLHFSSIGHVYMPYSVHVFGNYFIHGVPYYPDGTPVSSTYSGGCIRLADVDAEEVYNFIQKGTPIVITRDGNKAFTKTSQATSTLTSSDMTALMVATISLEVLTQDNEITSYDGTMTTRRSILKELVSDGNTDVAELYAQALGRDTFVALMNQKAQSLGLASTRFVDPTEPVATTYEDYERFMTYITTYKSYLRTLQQKS